MSEPTMTHAELTELHAHYRREAERAFADAEAKRDAELSRLQSENERLKAELEPLPGLERFLGLSKDELMQDDIAFLREDDRLALLAKHHTAGIVRALCVMVSSAEAERDQALEVVRELVRLRDLHDKLDRIPFALREESDWKMMEDYQHGKPLAWQAARLLSEKQ